MQTKKGAQLRGPFNLLLDYVSTKERGHTKSIWHIDKNNSSTHLRVNKNFELIKIIIGV